MFAVGQRVLHSGHGQGVVLEVRQVQAQESEYMQGERFASACAEDPEFGALCLSLTPLFSADRFPFRVRFDSGYEDVYAPTDLEAV